MEYKKLGDKFVIRLDKGDEIVSSIKSFCQKENIKSGTFFGIGATSEADLAYFDTKEKIYKSKTISGDLEITSLTGNIAEQDRKIFLHAHIVLSDTEYKAHAGHLNSAIISITCEITFIPFEGELKRKHNEEFSLNLLDI